MNCKSQLELELQGHVLAKRAAGTGIVLLKNEKNLLPLETGKRVGLYGSGAEYTIKGGTGSGDVNERYSVNILEGLENSKLKVTSKRWLDEFRSIYEETRIAWKNDILSRVHPEVPGEDFFGIYSTTPFQIPAGREITERDYREADTDTAIYVISRTAGEGKDRSAEGGDWKLSEEENRNIRSVSCWFSHIILVINAGGPVDLSILDELPQIQSVIYLSQAGMEGGNALGLILTGELTPSGKLTDSWAYRYEDYPNAASFSYQSGDTGSEEYKEGIYVGYRYFDTFDIPVRFPFGYGLSYTVFSMVTNRIVQKKERILISVTVENKGKRNGAEVVQVYVSCPQGARDKEKRRLCGFSKTKSLAPGEKQEIEVAFPIEYLSSFDREEEAYLLDAGSYGIFVGNSLNTAELAGMLQLEQKQIIKKVKAICQTDSRPEEIRPDAEKMKLWEQKWRENAKSLPALVLAPPFSCKKTEKPKKNEKVEKVLSDMTLEQKMTLLTGKIKAGPGSNLGSAGSTVPGSAGETVAFMVGEEEIPGMVLADGPAGIRLAQSYQLDDYGNPVEKDILEVIEHGIFSNKKTEASGPIYYQYCSAMPVGTLLAQTWDVELLRQVGEQVGKEMEEFGVSLWLAPGMNIHRNPLCGRNFEYFSEDPLISGIMAAAITDGVQSVPGAGTTIKHFACNNQEDNRIGSNSIVSERALREIYLRGFEIAVSLSEPMAIMTSYNLVNGIHAANNYDLCTQVARKEWGFQGLIMTDWFTTSPGGGSVPYRCIKAGNDLIMPGSPDDISDIRKAYECGELEESEITEAARHILSVIYRNRKGEK